jgi:hypothetical protein
MGLASTILGLNSWGSAGLGLARREFDSLWERESARERDEGRRRMKDKEAGQARARFFKFPVIFAVLREFGTRKKRSRAT